jgi:asparagine synthase (glutamine-hydrolysing)
MGGLCGWLGPAVDLGAARAALVSMLAVFPNRGASASRMYPGPIGALGAVCPEPRNRHVVPGEMACALVGTPVWTDERLAGIARNTGNGAALAAAWRLYGADLARRIAGDFAVAVVDCTRREAFLAVDRIGHHSLSYHADRAGLVFGTSLEAVRVHPMVDTDLSMQSLFDYFHLSVIPAPATIYRNVRKLQPAQYVHWRDGIGHTGFYWAMPEEEAHGDLPVLAEKMKFLLRRSVGDAVAELPRERVGVFLSGGLDSSTIAGLAAERFDGPVSCFTIGFDVGEFDESRYATIAARHFGARHILYDVTEADTASSLATIANSYDEPFGNSSCVPTYFCARLAREQGIEVLLAGDGGDEIFAGNARYVLQKQFDLYQRIPLPMRRMVEPLILGLPDAADGLAPLRKLRGYMRRARIPMPERLETYNFLHDGSHAGVFERDFLDSVNPLGPMEAIRFVYCRGDEAPLVRRMLNFDLQFTLADNDLRKVRGMCGLAGVDVRFPFLDDDVVAFSGKVPSDLLIRRLRLRHFYKEAMKDFLPAEIIAKQKHGFGLPFRVWLQKPGILRDLFGDTLSRFKKRGIVRSAFIDAMLSAWDPEEAKLYGQLVWYMVALELWLAGRERITTSCHAELIGTSEGE